MPEPIPQTSYALGYEESGSERFNSQGLLASLLDHVLQNAVVLEAIDQPETAPEGSIFNDFLADQLSIEQTLRLWLGDIPAQVESQGFAPWKRTAALRLAMAVAEIDRIVHEQLNAVLHVPRFQALEASWRGLQMLVESARQEDSRQVRVRMLNVSWREVQRDFERASEFDNSQIFRKVYEEEFGSPGGIPFSVLIGDYEIRPRPTPEHPYDDVAVLGHMAGVAAAAFCPFVCGAAPSLFGVDNFADLQNTKDLARGFQLPEFVKWRALRKSEDARFIGIAMPRILMREPYDLKDTAGFCFQEDVAADDVSKYLWGNAAYAWAGVAIRSFARTGWLADIRGTERNRDGGGLVVNLPSFSFGTDRSGVGLRTSTDLIITDQQEATLAKLGFLPLCQCHDTEYAAYYSSQSIQQSAVYDNPVATANANISSMMQYMLCVSRFAHYLKVIARDVVGAATEPEEMQSILDAWIKEYVTPDDSARPEVKAKRPLRQAEITVMQAPGRPGTFQCTFSLLPHYQLDDLTASIRLQTTTAKREH